MSDELETRLLQLQNLLHRQVEQIKGFSDECYSQEKFDDEFIKKTFVRLFDITADFYMNLESMYISNEAGTRQMDSIKDAIFSLKEVRENPALQEKFNRMFSSHDEALKESQKSFMKTYGIEEV